MSRFLASFVATFLASSLVFADYLNVSSKVFKGNNFTVSFEITPVLWNESDYIMVYPGMEVSTLLWWLSQMVLFSFMTG
jgi:hypothetical protein